MRVTWNRLDIFDALKDCALVGMILVNVQLFKESYVVIN